MNDIVDDRAVLRLCKRQIDGEDVGFQKFDWMRVIHGRGRDLFGSTLSEPQRFAKVIRRTSSAASFFAP